MKRLTVTWQAAAYDDVAKMFLDAGQRARVSRAVDEIETLLRVSPESKGRQLYARQLPVAVLDALFERMQTIPETIRLLQFGPIEVFFTCHPEDGQTRVWHLRSRPQ